MAWGCSDLRAEEPPLRVLATAARRRPQRVDVSICTRRIHLRTASEQLLIDSVHVDGVRCRTRCCRIHDSWPGTDGESFNLHRDDERIGECFHANEALVLRP